MVGKPRKIIMGQSHGQTRRSYTGIYAADVNDVIGNKNGLPWSIPEDMAFFKKTTQNSIVVMGHKTFDSLGLKDGLPNRINIVIASQRSVYDNNLYNSVIITPIKNVERIIDLFPDKPVFIIGGARVFTHFSSQIDTWYITSIEKEYLGDTVFRPPDLDTDFDKECVIQKFYSANEKCNVEITKWVRRAAPTSEDAYSIINNAPASEQNAIF